MCLIKGAFVGENDVKVIEYKMCVLIVYTNSETFLILNRIQRDIIIRVFRSSCKVPAILVRF
jgi:hypothetical protein